MIREPFKTIMVSLLILGGVKACCQTRQTIQQLPASAFEPLATYAIMWARDGFK